MKFGRVTCFGPRSNVIENGSDRSTFHITPSFEKRLYEYLQGDVGHLMAYRGRYNVFMRFSWKINWVNESVRWKLFVNIGCVDFDPWNPSRSNRRDITNVNQIMVLMRLTNYRHRRKAWSSPRIQKAIEKLPHLTL